MKALKEGNDIYGELHIINFNFTLESFGNNVHGNLKDGNIIFGIDDGVINDISGAHMFSKTYRKLHIDFGKETILPKRVDNIIFYGHSFGEADYSYFQSIFDYYDLYDSSVKLNFLHSYYHKDSDSYELEVTKRVYDLLKKYGETFGNMKGKNLLHKILIEGRIHVGYFKCNCKDGCFDPECKNKTGSNSKKQRPKWPWFPTKTG